MKMMIKNSKDPTRNSVWRLQQLSTYWMFIGITLALSAQLTAADLLKVRPRRDYSSSNSHSRFTHINNPPGDTTKQNVSCIAHDAKFTCDCRNSKQQQQLPRLFGSVFQVEISNCISLTINANALEETQSLRKITFRNIQSLVLHKYALAFPRYASNTPLIIEFEKVNFELIDSHAFNGNIEEISFVNGRIDVINAFGFTTLKDRAMLLRMDNMLVKQMEPQAFKKLAVEQLEITNCEFESNVPSKAFYELEVLSLLRLHNVRFQKVHSRAFSFKVISRLTISNNNFTAVDAEWIYGPVRGSVLIQDNYFGYTSPSAFKAITVHRDYISSERLELRFIQNTIRSTDELLPLEFNDRFAISLKQLRFENTYSCQNLDRSQKPYKPNTPFFQQHADSIFFQKEDAGNSGTINQSYIALSKVIELDCQQPTYILYIVLGVVVLVLIVTGIIFIVCLQQAKKRKHRKMAVVLPEPRTYKETQIVYQIENAGLLKTDL